MNRKFVGGVLISFFILLLLVILTFFIDFGKFSVTIYTVFIGILFYLAWVYTRKVTAKQLFRHFIALTLFSFFLLLLAQIVSFFAPKAIPPFIYYLLGIDALVLISLYIRKVFKREATYIDKIGYAISILIPLIIMGYVIYMNWLPFGFEKTYVLDVGSKGDTLVTKQIYLEKSDDLSEPIQDGEKTFRNLTGSTIVIFKPKAVLKNATVEIEIIGDNVFIVPPLEFNPSKYNWNLSIDFSKGIPDFLEGNAEFVDNCAFFDGQSSLEYPNTHDQFEEGPFSVYVEWTPESDKQDFQQIIGHYNWELIQDENKVRFRIGRMDNLSGKFYLISYQIEPDFFNNKHSALAVYNPSKKGYIELFVDGIFGERIFFASSKINPDYWNRPLSFGKSSHGSAKYYVGCVNKAMFSYDNINPFVKRASFYTSDETLEIPIVGHGKIDSIEIKVKR